MFHKFISAAYKKKEQCVYNILLLSTFDFSALNDLQKAAFLSYENSINPSFMGVNFEDEIRKYTKFNKNSFEVIDKLMPYCKSTVIEVPYLFEHNKQNNYLSVYINNIIKGFHMLPFSTEQFRQPVQEYNLLVKRILSTIKSVMKEAQLHVTDASVLDEVMQRSVNAMSQLKNNDLSKNSRVREQLIHLFYYIMYLKRPRYLDKYIYDYNIKAVAAFFNMQIKYDYNLIFKDQKFIPIEIVSNENPKTNSKSTGQTDMYTARVKKMLSDLKRFKENVAINKYNMNLHVMLKNIINEVNLVNDWYKFVTFINYIDPHRFDYLFEYLSNYSAFVDEINLTISLGKLMNIILNTIIKIEEVTSNYYMNVIGSIITYEIGKILKTVDDNIISIFMSISNVDKFVLNKFLQAKDPRKLWFSCNTIKYLLRSKLGKKILKTYNTSYSNILMTNDVIEELRGIVPHKPIDIDDKEKILAQINLMEL